MRYSYLMAKRAEPDYELANEQEDAGITDVLLICTNCKADVVLNYDGRGSGWSHMYDVDSPNYLSTGTKECAE